MKHGKYFLVSVHRAENVDCDKRVSACSPKYSMPLSQRRRTDPGQHAPAHPQAHRGPWPGFDPLVRLLKPFGFLDYNALQLSAHAVLSDSGSITEESAILGFPALNLRDAHERPEAMEHAVVMMTGFRPDRVLQASKSWLSRAGRSYRQTMRSPNVAEKIVRIILSYTDYVRRVVWKQSEGGRRCAS